jgi:metallo-beta-lactamase class B
MQEVSMNAPVIGLLSVAGIAIGLSVAGATGQSGANSVDVHVAAAKTAAGHEYTGVFDLLCPAPGPAQAPLPATPSQSPPDRSQWHAEPVKVFDNLYWVGQTEYSAWAVVTTDGIILIDTLYGYAVEDEVVGGLKKLGLDPATIKYAIVSHGHADHSGGAKYLQEHFGTRVILSAADWDLLDRSPEPKPKRDMVATDGQRLTLGGTTLTLYLTPGHTLGTISTLIPVTDGGTPHLVAEWGGTMFNWLRNRPSYITPATPERFWFNTYGTSARRFRNVVKRAGADALISNHTIYDGSKVKLPAMGVRKAGDPHPYVIGNDSVQRYLTVVDECAQAGLLRLK